MKTTQEMTKQTTTPIWLMSTICMIGLGMLVLQVLTLFS